jgi:hypothetical protein
MEDNNQPIVNNNSSGSNADQSASLGSASGPAYVSGETTTQQPVSPKRSPKKGLWASVILMGVLLAVSVVVLFWVHKPKTNKTSTKNTPAASAPKVAAPLVTTSAPATLKPGTYTVGPDKNIVPGLYSMSPGAQQSGNFTIISSTASYSVTLDDNSTGAVGDAKLAWAQLSTGDRVQISGGNLLVVNFRAAVMPASTPPALAKLYDDTFTVSDAPHKTNPGKYFITDSQDKNAYILIIDKNYNIKYNEPLDNTGFHAILEDGDQIATINMTAYLMKPE